MKRTNADKTGDLIDQNLRKAFQEMTEEELPDRFKDLLDKLKSGEPVQTRDEDGG